MLLLVLKNYVSYSGLKWLGFKKYILTSAHGQTEDLPQSRYLKRLKWFSDNKKVLKYD